MAKRKRKVKSRKVDHSAEIVCFGRRYRNLLAFAWNFGMSERWASEALASMTAEQAVDRYERRHDNRKKTYKDPPPEAVAADWGAWVAAGVNLNDPHPRIGKHESHKK